MWRWNVRHDARRAMYSKLLSMFSKPRDTIFDIYFSFHSAVCNLRRANLGTKSSRQTASFYEYHWFGFSYSSRIGSVKTGRYVVVNYKIANQVVCRTIPYAGCVRSTLHAFEQMTKRSTKFGWLFGTAHFRFDVSLIELHISAVNEVLHFVWNRCDSAINFRFSNRKKVEVALTAAWSAWSGSRMIILGVRSLVFVLGNSTHRKR